MVTIDRTRTGTPGRLCARSPFTPPSDEPDNHGALLEAAVATGHVHRSPFTGGYEPPVRIPIEPRIDTDERHDAKLARQQAEAKKPKRPKKPFNEVVPDTEPFDEPVVQPVEDAPEDLAEILAAVEGATR
jgi:hypothetical protein